MPAQERVSEVFVELADTLVDVFDVVEFLTTLADRSAELLGRHRGRRRPGRRVRHPPFGGVVQRDGSAARPVRAPEPGGSVSRLLPRREPPSSTRRSCRPTDGRPSGRRRGGSASASPTPFPCGFASASSARSTSSPPSDAQLTDPDVALARALADIATIALLQERNIREARVLNEQLQAALHSRVVIEQAKGMLAERRQIEMDEAFALLRGHARDTNQKLSDVAGRAARRHARRRRAVAVPLT